MHIGMVGLGKMGSNMSLRLLEGGHQVTAFDIDQDAVERFGRRERPESHRFEIS